MFNNENEFEQFAETLRFDDEPDHAHREKLEEQLLKALRKESKMNIWKAITATPITKVAAACVAAVLLVATAWGAEKAYRAFYGRVISESEVVADFPATEVTLPDGSKTQITGMLSRSIIPQEYAEKMKTIINQKKYEFLSSSEVLGKKQYFYKCTPPDGKKFVTGFICRLEEVDSWTDYEKKWQEQQQEFLERQKEKYPEHRKALSEAIAAGRVKLLEIKEIEVHICKNVESGEKIRVARFGGSGREAVAYISEHPINTSIGSRSHSTSWKDHLAAIESGKRELIEKRIDKLYMCEATLSDGTTALYGGGRPPVQKKE